MTEQGDLERSDLKRKILDLVRGMDSTKPLPAAEQERLKSLCDRLAAHSPVPEPMNHQQAAEGVWLSRFASFGGKHSEGQPLLHQTTLKIQSFGHLPEVPMRVTRMVQEIEQSSKAYNNIVHVANMAGDLNGLVVMHGRYGPDQGNPKRYMVEFYRVAFRPAEGVEDAAFRNGFGLPADIDLDRQFRPIPFHSDIVYLDDDLRINYGKLGGFYVLERLNSPGHSVLKG